MVKAMPKVYYKYDDKLLNPKSLYAAIRKKRGKAKILSSVVVVIGNDKDGNEVQAKIVFVRDKNRSR